ncbi:hypothetical protein ACPXCG_18715 [Gordonia sp. DT218]|uniref:aa3-type cytochrome oxidase subunit CtaJ n=1 Tax=unclassified Gordonia (in: high G+C Gram-positive bacteria) TaxID=2657482 RepID=UPI003CED92DE
MDNLIVAIGMPVTIICAVLVVACVIAMAFTFNTKYPKVSLYTLDQQWEHAPLLFSATGIEPMALAHHAESTDVDGGSASGKW